MNLVFWIATNILGQPAILIGLIVLLGLVLQKKNLSQTMTGTFKAVIGFMIINGGAG
ncbi:MAG: PTS transporter subunit IIC, partial [Tepidanaerobacteraceae bacterium]